MNELICENNLNLKTISDHDSYLKILHYNIRSIYKNIDYLDEILHSQNVEFDIICLSETWYKEKSKNLYANHLQNYYFKHKKDQPEKTAGIAIFIKKELIFNFITDDIIADCDYLTIEITKSNNKKIYIHVIYKHPKNNINTFLDNIENILLKYKTHEQIIIGDLNIDIKKGNNKIQTQKYLTTLLTKGFYNLLTNNTRETKNTKTLIDHIFYNKILNNTIYSGNLTTKDLDHYPNYVFIPTEINSNKQITKKIKRYFNKENINKFNSFIHNLELETSNSDLNKVYKSFEESINNHFNNLFPLKRMSIQKSKNKPWMTKGILKCIHKKQKLYKNSINNYDNYCTSKYKTYKNTLRKIIDKTKNNYYINLFTKLENNTKQLWYNMNKVIGKTNKTSTNINEIEHNNNTYKNPKDITNIFNDLFSNTNYLKQNINKMKFTSNNSDNIIQTTPKEIENYLTQLKNNCSLGIYDKIPIWLIKYCKTNLSIKLSKLINLSIEQEIYPDSLKQTKIIPIYKSDNKKIITNYRPISILPIFSKIFEKTIQKRLLNYLNEKNIIYNQQYGFQKNKCTLSAISYSYNHIFTNKADKYYTIALFIDFKKAFDMVSHEILINKMHKLNLPISIITYLENYLMKRNIQTVIKDTVSDNATLNCGVPQGSILGPILFLIYINDLKDNLSSKIINFADDTLLLLRAKSQNELQIIVNKDIKHIIQWLQKNNLEINANKTKYLFIPPQNKIKNNIIITINNTTIDQVQSYKYLGFTMDEKLNFKEHVFNIIKKIRQKIHIFYHIRNLLPIKAKYILYNALIKSHIEYCIEVYNIANKTTITKLNQVHKKIIKTLFFIKNKTKINYHELNIRPLDQLIQKTKMKYSWKAYNSNIDYFKNEIKNSDLHRYPTKNKNKMHINNNDTKNKIMFYIKLTILDMPNELLNSKNKYQFNKTYNKLYPIKNT